MVIQRYFDINILIKIINIIDLIIFFQIMLGIIKM